MGMPSGPVVLPFKSEKLSFGLVFGSGSAPDAVELELAAVCFDRNGTLLDAAHSERRSAFLGALRLAPAAKGLDASVVMRPFDFAPQCEVIMLAVSAPASAVRRSDLGCAKQLRFAVSAREKGAEETQILDVDLTPFVGFPAKAGAGTLTNGHQSMLVCAVYSTPGGWTLSFDCSTVNEDNWGAMLPHMERSISRWPFLSAAEALSARGPAGALVPITVSRPGTDYALTDLLKSVQQQPQQRKDDQSGGGEAAAAADTGVAAAAGTVDPAAAGPLVLELGWTLHPPKRPQPGEGDEEGAEEEEEEEEDPELEFALAAYSMQGEEVQVVSPKSPEGEGLAVADPDAEEDEAAQEEGATAEGDGDAEGVDGGKGAEEPAAEGGAAAEGEEGEGGAEGEEGEGEAAEEDEEAAAAKRAAAAAEAEARRLEEEAERRAAALRKPYYPEPFPRKHKVAITLQELPPATRSLLLTISNFGGGGLKRVSSLQARLLAPGAGKGKERVLLHCRFVSGEGADEALTQVAMLKLYRDLSDGAFATWAASGTPDARALSEAAGSKDTLKSILEARKQLVAEVAAARIKAEEEGADEDEDLLAADEEDEEDVIAEAEAAPGGVCGRSGRVQRARLRRAPWRVRALVVAAGGEEVDETLVTNSVNYEGKLAHDGTRLDTAAKAMFPNGDTYFGGYEADAKAGAGLYVFASGAAHLGEYTGGRQAGRGLMVLPDGGVYEGEFAADRFDGQGSYHYPDGSVYTGAWKAGKRHGLGMFWDTAGGCLRGEWERGELHGSGSYDQPNYHFEGRFVGSVPAGPCSFYLPGFRSAGLPVAATGYLVAQHGATLKGEGAYTIPPGSGERPPEGEDEAAADPDRPQLPAFPDYSGLGYASADVLPTSVADVPFPPPAAVC